MPSSKKNEREKIKCLNCGLNHVSNCRGAQKTLRNIKNIAPAQNSILHSNPVREGTSFADVAKVYRKKITGKNFEGYCGTDIVIDVFHSK